MKKAVLSGLEALEHGATKIEIPVEGETIYLTKLGPKRFQVTIAAKEEKFGRRQSGLKDRRANRKDRRGPITLTMSDRREGEERILRREGIGRRTGRDRRLGLKITGTLVEPKPPPHTVSPPPWDGRGRRMSEVRDRRARITGRRLLWPGKETDRKKGENKWWVRAWGHPKRRIGAKDRRSALTGRRTSWKHLPEETFFGKRSRMKGSFWGGRSGNKRRKGVIDRRIMPEEGIVHTCGQNDQPKGSPKDRRGTNGGRRLGIETSELDRKKSERMKVRSGFTRRKAGEDRRKGKERRITNLSEVSG